MPAVTCEACGTELRANAKFCDQCGRPATTVGELAEYKQVTVIFTDVVRSMDLAAALDTERLREIMSDLLRRSSDVVRRYGGTINSFNGDGVMALFGAPVALEDHAVRACLAALDIQREAASLAEQVKRRDAIALSLRVGLNSGRVIAGAVGAEPWSYTAVGEQVGMAQRMESAAPPGGVMLSQSTARLVEHCASLGEPELIRIKNREDPVVARQLIGIGAGRTDRVEAALVGRRPEMAALDETLQRAINGRGSTVILAGAAGIGKSRLAREVEAVAAGRDMDVVSVAAESHCAEIPFMVVARLLRSLTGFHDLDAQEAREALRELASDGDEQDLLLLADLLGSRDPAAASAALDPDARRRRLSALVIRIVRERVRPALCIVEHARWTDPASQSILADLAAEMHDTRSVLLITQRPEYSGALKVIAGARSIVVEPLNHSDTAALVGELIGADSSVAAVAKAITQQAAGNPFFAEEIVRDLRDRGVLEGQPGAFRCTTEVTDITVPATVQAAVTARIDRLSAPAKRTLCAAAVIGDRFSADVLTSLGVQARVDELVEGDFIDEIVTRRAHLAVLGAPQSQEYAFRQGLIRSVAYDSQLRSARAGLHRRLAAIIQERDPDAVDANAERVAEHLESAGDLRDAYDWHIRAGTWLSTRDIASAHLSWKRARRVADRLPRDEPEVLGMRIAPRAALCASMWLIGGSVADTGFSELDELCAQAGDKVSLAFGMAGQVMSWTLHNEVREAARLGAEHIALLESIGDPTLLMGMSHPGVLAHCQAGEMAEALRVGERVVELAAGDANAGNFIVGSPLAIATAMCSFIKCSMGIPGWRRYADEAMAMARGCDAITHATVTMYKYVPVMYGAIALGDDALRDTAEAVRIAERSGDDFTVGFARFTRGVVLIHHENADTAEGLELFAAVRELSAQERLSMTMLPPIDTHLARAQADAGDLDGAIKLCRNLVDDLHATSGMLYLGMSAELLGELLLRRGMAGDLDEVGAVIDRLSAVRTDPGYVFNELSMLRLRALLARAQGDEASYRIYAKDHGELANSIGFEESMSTAAAIS
ncbi:adenylate/guanylate cyclase domain-containing protein [Mycobacterium sp. Aquia_213]|uniref:adenylate/guanylate cyclase domain-containing protein n=1 Tax=Mycobacterium sp. Aquia_213 TaxID=2991728 RepID=UPI00226E2851|nr:adenylate/guanylate cyclase domain-containing protein [Mycobacterium sp. Aquia_213]WAC90087.1 AAA family ATPase [Mycobacterium sp. Aquia_213]